MDDEPYFSSRQYAAYLCGALLLSLIPAVAVFFLNASIFGCTAHGYSPGTYLGDCSKPTYGEYERGAIFFNLEKKAVRALKASDVVYFGWSHGLVGLSTNATEKYFRANQIRYFNAGFSGEFSSFYDLLIPRLGLNPKVIIIDAQRFFGGYTSQPSALIRDHPWRAHLRYAVKKAWQSAHRWACQVKSNPMSSFCGPHFASYRSWENGRLLIDYRLIYGNPLPKHPIVRGTTFDHATAEISINEAKAFIARHSLNASCIVLMSPPNSLGSEALVAAIANGIGATFVDVDIPNLDTVDGGHLNSANAEKWSAAFWNAADATIKRCRR
jgi:hypothetical protein